MDVSLLCRTFVGVKTQISWAPHRDNWRKQMHIAAGRMYEPPTTSPTTSETSRKRVGSESEACRKRVGSVSEACRKRVGSVSEACRKRLGSVSETCRKRLGNVSEAARKRLGNVSSTPANADTSSCGRLVRIRLCCRCCRRRLRVSVPKSLFFIGGVFFFDGGGGGTATRVFCVRCRIWSRGLFGLCCRRVLGRAALGGVRHFSPPVFFGR